MLKDARKKHWQGVKLPKEACSIYRDSDRREEFREKKDKGDALLLQCKNFIRSAIALRVELNNLTGQPDYSLLSKSSMEMIQLVVFRKENI